MCRGLHAPFIVWFCCSSHQRLEAEVPPGVRLGPGDTVTLCISEARQLLRVMIALAQSAGAAHRVPTRGGSLDQLIQGAKAESLPPGAGRQRCAVLQVSKPP